MPPLERDDFVETITVWNKAQDTRHGQVRVERAHHVLNARWTDKWADVKRPDGSTVRIDATIATSEDLPIGAFVYRNLLGYPVDDLNIQTGTGTVVLSENQHGPIQLPDLPAGPFMQVVFRNVAFDVRGAETRYEFGLMKWGFNLPLV
jgi:hypothetical protein